MKLILVTVPYFSITRFHLLCTYAYHSVYFSKIFFLSLQFLIPWSLANSFFYFFYSFAYFFLHVLSCFFCPSLSYQFFWPSNKTSYVVTLCIRFAVRLNNIRAISQLKHSRSSRWKVNPTSHYYVSMASQIRVVHVFNTILKHYSDISKNAKIDKPERYRPERKQEKLVTEIVILNKLYYV